MRIKARGINAVHRQLATGETAPGRVQVMVSYADGFRRSLQTKTLVEAGDAIRRDGAGNVHLLLRQVHLPGVLHDDRAAAAQLAQRP